MSKSNNKAWLVAAWPGMGNVAVIAAGFLVQALDLDAVAEVNPRTHFDVQSIDIKQGMISTPHLPRNILFKSKKPIKGRDLIVLLAEAQPAHGSFTFAHELLEKIEEYNVGRVITFASLASQLHPTEDPKVFGAVTQGDLLEEVKGAGVRLMEEGQIGGMNGVLLGAAANRGMEGVCLLGEIPFFAAGIANPKAARAILTAFAAQWGIDLDTSELARHAEVIDQALVKMLENMQERGETGDNEEDEDGPSLEEAVEQAIEQANQPADPKAPAPDAKNDNKNEKSLDFATRNRIEKLFEAARKDRKKAMHLKQELDKLNVFKQYEDRFLDLFRRAE